MQNGIIDEILRIEDEAKEITENAETRASEIVLQAEEAARETVRKALEGVRARGEEKVLAAEKEADEAIRALETSGTADGGLDPKSQQAYERALDRAVKRVLDI